MSVLLCAKQIANAAKLHIAHSDLKARAELSVLANGLKALCRDLADRLVARIGKVGIRAARRASDASADLVKLRKSEAVCALNNQGVGVGNIHARLNDRRANEHVDLARKHLAPDVLKLLLVHFSVRDGNPRLGDRFCDLRGTGVDIFHKIIQIKDLTASAKLAANGLDHNQLIVLQHVGLHGQTLTGRFVEHRDIANAAHRHIERTRNGRCRQCQHIDVLGELLELLLLRHAKSLLLVDDEQTEIMKFDVLGNEAVRADDDIGLAALEAAQRQRLLLRRAEARDHIDVDRKRAHTARKGLIMLECEERGRHKNRHLLAAKHRLICSTHRDLGLTEAYVTAKQAIHRARLHHVLFNILDRGNLCLGLLIFKARLEIGLQVVILRKCKPGTARALGIELDQILGDILDRCLSSRLGTIPLIAAKARELDKAVIGMCADILGHHIELIHGQKEAVTSRIADVDIVTAHAVDRQIFNAHILTDTVDLMHHEIAHLKVIIRKNGLRAVLFLASALELSALAERALSALGRGRQHRNTRRGHLVAANTLSPFDKDHVLRQCCNGIIPFLCLHNSRKSVVGK